MEHDYTGVVGHHANACPYFIAGLSARSAVSTTQAGDMTFYVFFHAFSRSSLSTACARRARVSGCSHASCRAWATTALRPAPKPSVV